MLKKSRHRFSLNHFRNRLAHIEAAPQLAALGILSGLCTGAVVLAFRFVIETPLETFLPNGDPENFEGLSPLVRFALPIAGAFIIGLGLMRLHKKYHAVGVSHVIDRLHFHQGYLNSRNAIVQFVGGALAVITGQSVGREGPAVHLGAATSSLLGQWFNLPNNSIRTLVGCGTAAAIAASFNTPIAGVIFAMEVVVMEYTISGFLPVILAAVTGTFLTHAVYGDELAFSVPYIQITSLWEIPYIILLGIIVGCAAALLIHCITFFMRFTDKPLWLRTTSAGFIVGSVALFTPEIMGIGYDTVNLALIGSISATALLAIALLKLLTTSAVIGLGIPGGIIGTTIVIGATLGSSLAGFGHAIFPELSSNAALYGIIGMAAMMGATLQAPLAALMAVLELTNNPNIILPAMLSIVFASLTSSEIFKKRSIFLTILQNQGLSLKQNPITQTLQRAGITSTMDKNFIICDRYLKTSENLEEFTSDYEWIIIETDGKPISLMHRKFLTLYLSQLKGSAHNEADTDDSKKEANLDLLAIPAERHDLQRINAQATLHEALEKLNKTQVSALTVHQQVRRGKSVIIGVVTRDQIENHYHA